MNIRQLKIFREAALTENMTTAAERLFLSQPAVSQTIRELEEELTLQLFDRQGRAIKLNAVGQTFLERTLSFLSEYEELEAFAQGVKYAPLKIGATITIANHWLPAILTDYQTQGGEAEIHIDTAERVLHSLQNHEVDLALVEGLVDEKTFDSFPFASYEMKAILQKNHPYAEKKALTGNELVKQPLLLRDTSSAIRQALDSWLKLQQLQAQPFITSINSQALIESVRAGLGITVLPEILLNNCRTPTDFQVVPLAGAPLINRLYFVLNNGQQVTKRIEAFRSQMKQLAKEVTF